ncbi:hypothetical protein ACHAQA_005425 [Verticillium albo-atrum]
MSTTVDTVAQSCNATYNRPKTRQRVHKAPPPLDVPDIDEDAAERKRVLNVLAQRRYRERKRDKHNARTKTKQQEPHPPPAASDEVSGAAPPENPAAAASGPPLSEPLPVPEPDILDLDLPWDATSLEETAVPCLAEGFAYVPYVDTNWDSLSSSSSSSGFITDSTTLDTTINPTYLAATSTSVVSSPRATSFTPPPPPVDDFADRYLLPISDLTLLSALINIAGRMGCSSEVWSPLANSPFNLGVGTPAALLPTTWRPTPTQVQLPHHPVLDFLPWPAVRDRIISVFNMPVALRPPGARDPLALMNFAYDMEDQAEGVRIWGGDPYDETGWEVGQVFFERWWFIFDRDVVAQSNRLREMRGAARLRMKEPRVEELR